MLLLIFNFLCIRYVVKNGCVFAVMNNDNHPNFMIIRLFLSILSLPKLSTRLCVVPVLFCLESGEFLLVFLVAFGRVFRLSVTRRRSSLPEVLSILYWLLNSLQSSSTTSLFKGSKVCC